jgi:hypothetical protein
MPATVSQVVKQFQQDWTRQRVRAAAYEGARLHPPPRALPFPHAPGGGLPEPRPRHLWRALLPGAADRTERAKARHTGRRPVRRPGVAAPETSHAAWGARGRQSAHVLLPPASIRRSRGRGPVWLHSLGACLGQSSKECEVAPGEHKAAPSAVASSVVRTGRFPSR